MYPTTLLEGDLQVASQYSWAAVLLWPKKTAISEHLEHESKPTLGSPSKKMRWC